MQTITEIHPYDFAELIWNAPTNPKLVDSFKSLGAERYEVDGQVYLRTVKAPRSAGEHFIF